MSTILRGYTSTENHALLQSSELNIDIKSPEDDRIDFIIDVTDKDFQDFNGQIKDTIRFLTGNFSQLSDLKNKVADLKWEVDYGYNTKVATGELAVEGLHFPLQLLSLCTELKLEILVSLYDGNLFGWKKEARRCEPGSAF
jgi:hypothetical protein